METLRRAYAAWQSGRHLEYILSLRIGFTVRCMHQTTHGKPKGPIHHHFLVTYSGFHGALHRLFLERYC